jgi:antitoxin ParD1/3/4
MHISLTPELEDIIKEKVATGLYNNASEVVREALRFMKMHEELVYQMKLANVRAKLAEGKEDIKTGRYTELAKDDIAGIFQAGKTKALAAIQDNARNAKN